MAPNPTSRVCGAANSDITTTSLGRIGAALATYLTLDLVRGPIGGRVSGCFFASPHPGNAVFATLFDQTNNGYQVYNYIFDIVP
jgi:hypothetical protein